MFVIGLVLAAVFMMAVMRWWSEGMFETSDAILLIVVFGGLIFGFFAVPSWPGRLITFVPLGAAASYVLYSYKQGSMRAYYRDLCRNYIDAIQVDPRNLGARESLADTLYNLGELDRAIDEMQAACDLGAGMQCQYKLGKWTRERHLRDTSNPVCKWCATENPQGARKCAKCGADLPFENGFTQWILGGKTAGARKYLLLVIGVALVCVSVVLLPIKFALIPALLWVLALVGWSLVGSAR